MDDGRASAAALKEQVEEAGPTVCEAIHAESQRG